MEEKKSGNIWKLIAAIVICEATGIIGSLVTDSDSEWYRTLVKPSFNPPSWVFAPVWTTLYLLMGIAAYLVWKQGLQNRAVKQALLIFVAQLVLNGIWSPVFFGMHQVGGALLVIILLWLMIVLTILRFYPLSRVAAYLLIPYLLWVSFASVLNFAIWRLN